jgi:hypothetical protein
MCSPSPLEKITIYTALTNPDFDAVECWKPFNIPNCITYIKQALDAFKTETVITC